MSESTLRIGVVAPEVLGTNGDTGNALVLAERARRRGIRAEIVKLPLPGPIPSELDIYTLGGGEDTAQALAARQLRAERGLQRATRAQKPILAVCASLQILGQLYVDAEGNRVEGLGLLDLQTFAGSGRVTGELVTEPLIPGLSELLTGFENHGGRTRLGPDAAPLGTVKAGIGNGFAGVDGAVQGSIIGTYMHGPVLARNPQLADYILETATGETLRPLHIPAVEILRRRQLRAAGL